MFPALTLIAYSTGSARSFLSLSSFVSIFQGAVSRNNLGTERNSATADRLVTATLIRAARVQQDAGGEQWERPPCSSMGDTDR